MGFCGKLRRSIKYYKQFCKDRANMWRLSETQARQELATAMTDLQNDQVDLAKQETLSRWTEKIQSFVDKKLNGQQIRSRVKWLQCGDKASKD